MGALLRAAAVVPAMTNEERAAILTSLGPIGGGSTGGGNADGGGATSSGQAGGTPSDGGASASSGTAAASGASASSGTAASGGALGGTLAKSPLLLAGIMGSLVVGAVASSTLLLREPQSEISTAELPVATTPATEAPAPPSESSVALAEASAPALGVATERPSPPPRTKSVPSARARDATETRPIATTAEAPADPRAEAEIGSLAEESALIGRARASLEGAPTQALEALERHSRRFARGELAAERDYLMIKALRKVGRHDEARERARAYPAQHGSSPYAPAVKKLLVELGGP